MKLKKIEAIVAQIKHHVAYLKGSSASYVREKLLGKYDGRAERMEGGLLNELLQECRRPPRYSDPVAEAMRTAREAANSYGWSPEEHRNVFARIAEVLEDAEAETDGKIIEEQRQKLADKDDEIEGLERQIMQLYREGTSKYQKATKLIQNLHEELRQIYKENSGLKDDQQATKEAADYYAKQARLFRDIANQENMRQNAVANEVDKLRSESSELGKAVQNLHGQIKEANETIVDLNGKLATVESENERLRGENAELEQMNRRQRQTIEELDRAAKKRALERATFATDTKIRLEKLRAQLAEAEEQKRMWRRRYELRDSDQFTLQEPRGAIEAKREAIEKMKRETAAKEKARSHRQKLINEDVKRFAEVDPRFGEAESIEALRQILGYYEQISVHDTGSAYLIMRGVMFWLYEIRGGVCKDTNGNEYDYQDLLTTAAACIKAGLVLRSNLLGIEEKPETADETSPPDLIEEIYHG